MEHGSGKQPSPNRTAYCCVTSWLPRRVYQQPRQKAAEAGVSVGTHRQRVIDNEFFHLRTGVGATLRLNTKGESR